MIKHLLTLSIFLLQVGCTNRNNLDEQLLINSKDDNGITEKVEICKNIVNDSTFIYESSNSALDEDKQVVVYCFYDGFCEVRTKKWDAFSADFFMNFVYEDTTFQCMYINSKEFSRYESYRGTIEFNKSRIMIHRARRETYPTCSEDLIQKTEQIYSLEPKRTSANTSF